MKICDIRSYVVFGGWRNWIFVELLTDSGITGYGEATLEGKEKAVVGAIEDLSRYLIGQDPRQVEYHRHTMFRDSYWRQGPVLNTALGGIEIAMWDTLAQSLGVPVYRLFGGPVREHLPAYANGWYFGAKTLEEYVERAVSTVDAGFKALKWDPFNTAYFDITDKDEIFAVECVREVRNAVGPNVKLMIEAHGRFSPTTALRLIYKLEPYDITWLEEPVPPDNLVGLRRVVSQSPIPIAVGERFFTRADFLQPLAENLLSYAQPDVLHVGGLSEARKVAAIAEGYGIAVCPHNAAGPIGTAATLHLAASTPNFGMLEYFFHDAPWRDEVCQPAIVVSNGMASIPSAPGLGLKLNHEVIKKYPYRPRDLNFFSSDSTLTHSPLEAK